MFGIVDLIDLSSVPMVLVQISKVWLGDNWILDPMVRSFFPKKERQDRSFSHVKSRGNWVTAMCKRSNFRSFFDLGKSKRVYLGNEDLFKLYMEFSNSGRKGSHCFLENCRNLEDSCGICS